MKRLLLVLAIFGPTLAIVPSAFGDVYSFYLTVDKSPLTSPPADSVLVTVSRTDAHDATVTFTGENGYYMDQVLINVDGAFNIGAITGSPTATQTYAHAADQGIDTFGAMSENITPNGNDPSSVITIALTTGLGNSWDNAFDVLTRTCRSSTSTPPCVGGYGVADPNGSPGYGHQYAQGFDAAATIGLSSAVHTAHDDDNEDLAGFEVPEPASLLLFGSVVLLLATFARRKSAAKV